jgi:hypothetical protein
MVGTGANQTHRKIVKDPPALGQYSVDASMYGPDAGPSGRRRLDPKEIIMKRLHERLVARLSNLAGCGAVGALFCLAVPSAAYADGYAYVRGCHTYARAWAENRPYGTDRTWDYDREEHWWERSDAYAYAPPKGDCRGWAKCRMWARSYGSCGGWGQAYLSGDYGPGQPFGPIQPDASVPIGETCAHVELSADPQGLVLQGRVEHNANGRLEIALVDMRESADCELIELIESHGSVERALSAEAIEPSRVLGRWRESDFDSGADFALPVETGCVASEDIALILIIDGTGARSDDAAAAVADSSE